MTPSLLTTLRQIRADLAAALALATIRRACAAADHTWRDRVLDPVATVHLFVLQILHGNTACAHLPRLTGQTFSASACVHQARRGSLTGFGRVAARPEKPIAAAEQRPPPGYP